MCLGGPRQILQALGVAGKGQRGHIWGPGEGCCLQAAKYMQGLPGCLTRPAGSLVAAQKWSRAHGLVQGCGGWVETQDGIQLTQGPGTRPLSLAMAHTGSLWASFRSGSWLGPGRARHCCCCQLVSGPAGVPQGLLQWGPGLWNVCLDNLEECPGSRLLRTLSGVGLPGARGWKGSAESPGQAGWARAVAGGSRGPSACQVLPFDHKMPLQLPAGAECVERLPAGKAPGGCWWTAAEAEPGVPR